jgi:F-type H+-transporting ATPase subunit delta
MSLAAANRYARALADIALDPKSGLAADAAVAQLDAFQQVLDASAELRNVLATPAVSPAKKRAAVARLGGQLGLHRLILSFLNVLIDHRRTGLFREVREAFGAEVDARLGVVRAQVAAAQPLGGAQRAALESKIAGITGKQVHCSYTVDPALLGGVAVKMGSKFYDGSVRGQLDALRRRLSSGA